MARSTASVATARRTPAASRTTVAAMPQSRLSLWETVHELNALGQTILLTTHYMEEADQLCERVAIMDHGKILALDTPEGLKASTGADTAGARTAVVIATPPPARARRKITRAWASTSPRALPIPDYDRAPSRA